MRTTCFTSRPSALASAISCSVTSISSMSRKFAIAFLNFGRGKAVLASVNNGNYLASVSGTLVISKAAATITLGGLTHTYDGSAKSATVTTSPEGLSVRPAGSVPDHVYGEWPPLARKLVEKKLLTNTLLPAPMSHTPFVHVMNCVLIASGGVVPAPEPVSGTLLSTLL